MPQVLAEAELPFSGATIPSDSHTQPSSLYIVSHEVIVTQM